MAKSDDTAAIVDVGVDWFLGSVLICGQASRQAAEDAGHRRVALRRERRSKLRLAKAAALRSRAAGSQDELRCSAIHKPPHSQISQAGKIGRRDVRSRCRYVPATRCDCEVI